MSTATSTPQRLPALFVSHGSPMFALEPGTSGAALRQFGQQLLDGATPLRGVVVMSPHWMAHGAAVMTHPQPATWHDFGGFPTALYRLQYPAPGAPVLAGEVLALLAQAGVPAQPDPERPFDHGAWVPLMHLFPQAQLPVVQVALPVDAGPREVYAMGQALSGLRKQGVLLMGTGSMTHNLRDFFVSQPPPAQDAEPAAYVPAFSRWVEARIQAQDRDALLQYREQAPSAVRAHPSDDHFLPLFFALGAAGWGGPAQPTVDYLTREVQYSFLAMDSLALH